MTPRWGERWSRMQRQRQRSRKRECRASWNRVCNFACINVLIKYRSSLKTVRGAKLDAEAPRGISSLRAYLYNFRNILTWSSSCNQSNRHVHRRCILPFCLGLCATPQGYSNRVSGTLTRTVRSVLSERSSYMDHIEEDWQEP